MSHPVVDALGQQVNVIVGHLDLEGFAYVKITRTGAEECFASDVTSEVLKKEGFDYKEQKFHFWKRPACDRFKGRMASIRS